MVFLFLHKHLFGFIFLCRNIKTPVSYIKLVNLAILYSLISLSMRLLLNEIYSSFRYDGIIDLFASVFGITMYLYYFIGIWLQSHHR